MTVLCCVVLCCGVWDRGSGIRGVDMCTNARRWLSGRTLWEGRTLSGVVDARRRCCIVSVVDGVKVKVSVLEVRCEERAKVKQLV